MHLHFTMVPFKLLSVALAFRAFPVLLVLNSLIFYFYRKNVYTVATYQHGICGIWDLLDGVPVAISDAFLFSFSLVSKYLLLFEVS